MSEKHSSKDAANSDAAAMGRAIADASNQRAGSFHRPSEDAVLAYLRGSATEPQRAEVRRALAASREFREELAALGETLEQMERPDAVERFHEARIPGSRSSADLHPAAPPPGPTRSNRLLWVRALWMPLGAAAVIAALLLSQPGRYGQSPVGDLHWTRVPERLSPGAFEQMTLRGDAADAATHPSALNAAIESFRTRIEYEDGRLLLREAPTPDAAGPTGAARPVEPGQVDRSTRSPHADRPATVGVMVDVLDPSGSRIVQLRGALPAEHSDRQAWLVSIPDLALSHAALCADSTRSIHGGPTPTKGFVLFTYQAAESYHATAPQFFLNE